MKINKKILIAEDELLIAKVLRLQLEKLGFEVDNVMDADKAFSAAQQMKPDIIIMDVFLKNKSSGIEAALRIREINNKTPIIFTTGNSYDDTIRLIKNINYCWVLNKPIDFEELVKLLNKF